MRQSSTKDVRRRNCSRALAAGLVVASATTAVGASGFLLTDEAQAAGAPCVSNTLGVLLNGTGSTSDVVVSGPDIFATRYGANAIGEYTNAGTVVNASLVSGLGQPTGLALSGPDIFVVNNQSSTVGEYTTSGATVNATLLSDPSGAYFGVAAAGPDIFVTDPHNNTVGEYTTTGATVNASLVSGLGTVFGIAISGPDIFVVNYSSNTIGEYTVTGATVNAALVSGLHGPVGIAVSGSNIFVTNSASGTIGEYTTAGATVNAALVSGLHDPYGVAVYGSDIFVASTFGTSIREYTTSGALVSVTCVTGSLSGGGVSGTTITVPPRTAVTDQAALTGTNGPAATGTVTYNVYSNSTCTAVVSTGTPETITTPGTLPPSKTASLPAGTYYWQVSYSGDTNNATSVSPCGSGGAIETVTAASVTTSTTAATTTTTVAPARKSTVPVVSIARSTLTAKSGKVVAVLVCAVSACRGTLSLTSTKTSTVKRGATTVKTQKTIVFGSGSYAVPRGHQLSETITLNAAGRAEFRLASAKHPVAVTLKVTLTHGATTSKRVTVV